MSGLLEIIFPTVHAEELNWNNYQYPSDSFKKKAHTLDCVSKLNLSLRRGVQVIEYDIGDGAIVSEPTNKMKIHISKFTSVEKQQNLKTSNFEKINESQQKVSEVESKLAALKFQNSELNKKSIELSEKMLELNSKHEELNKKILELQDKSTTIDLKIFEADENIDKKKKQIFEAERVTNPEGMKKKSGLMSKKKGALFLIERTEKKLNLEKTKIPKLLKKINFGINFLTANPQILVAPQSFMLHAPFLETLEMYKFELFKKFSGLKDVPITLEMHKVEDLPDYNPIVANLTFFEEMSDLSDQYYILSTTVKEEVNKKEYTSFCKKDQASNFIKALQNYKKVIGNCLLSYQIFDIVLPKESVKKNNDLLPILYKDIISLRNTLLFNKSDVCTRANQYFVSHSLIKDKDLNLGYLTCEKLMKVWIISSLSGDAGLVHLKNYTVVLETCCSLIKDGLTVPEKFTNLHKLFTCYVDLYSFWENAFNLLCLYESFSKDLVSFNSELDVIFQNEENKEKWINEEKNLRFERSIIMFEKKIIQKEQRCATNKKNNVTSRIEKIKNEQARLKSELEKIMSEQQNHVKVMHWHKEIYQSVLLKKAKVKTPKIAKKPKIVETQKIVEAPKSIFTVIWEFVKSFFFK